MLGALAAIGILLWFQSSVGVLASIATAWGAFAQWLLFSCLAEHLRLQKKLAGERFQGRISGPQEEIIWACSQCHHMLHSETHCEVCRATIVADDVGLNS
ncbi:hypothetical protein UC8_24880 [Roseimaritima ulvae]|uniref:Uncharacterized protein n=1 Tax=Roseimaritima ulvae TaxID=980254 RepID=A0A5B9QTR9_9BACT|nr:hypothetical protein UC8_24880 [Roseimaritima ulvae]